MDIWSWNGNRKRTATFDNVHYVPGLSMVLAAEQKEGMFPISQQNLLCHGKMRKQRAMQLNSSLLASMCNFDCPINEIDRRIRATTTRCTAVQDMGAFLLLMYTRYYLLALAVHKLSSLSLSSLFCVHTTSIFCPYQVLTNVSNYI